MKKRKIWLKVGMVIAAMAFVVPASALANEDGSQFTHEGEVIDGEEIVPTHLEGTLDFTTGIGGIHCGEFTLAVDLKAEGTGTTTAYDAHCTTSSGFPVHSTAEELHQVGMWEIHSMNNGTFTIDEFTIHNSIRHPITTHLEIATNTWEGHLTASLNETGDTVTLYNDIGAVRWTVFDIEHPENPPAEAEIFLSGHLTITNGEEGHTHLGVLPGE